MAKVHHMHSSWKHINRRHMGHIAHLIIQFKSVNTFAQAMIIYHIIEKERKKPISFLRTEWSLFEKPRVPFTQGCFVSSLVEIGLEVLEKIFIFLQYNMLFHNYLPPGKRCGPSFEQSWIAFTHGCFVPSLVEIDLVVLE